MLGQEPELVMCKTIVLLVCIIFLTLFNYYKLTVIVLTAFIETICNFFLNKAELIYK